MIASSSFGALGTSATVVVTRAEILDHATALLAKELSRLDEACSRFRPDSELSRANARAGHAVEASPLLQHAVATAIHAAEATGGLVTPTLGSVLSRAGYDRTFELVRARRSWTVQAASSPKEAWREIEVDAERGTLRVPRGVELDLGATAKAFAADSAAGSIAAAVNSGVLVSLGGDVAIGGKPPQSGWVVRIAERHDAPIDSAGPSIVLNSGGLATSSTAVRRWSTDRGEGHHVIDPRTAAPAATPWVTVSVAAESCVAANVGALGGLVVGPAAPDWLESRGLHARMVGRDGAVAYAGAWPTDREPV